MLSYRHAFHAGNHADVLKHLTLVLCCEYFCRKDKGFMYVDTHAGAGMYNLSSSASQQTKEHEDGIYKLLDLSSPPKSLTKYLELINQASMTNPMNYPGSPWLAAQFIRPHDQATLFELHPNDFQHLNQLFSKNKKIRVNNSDGYQSLKSLFPPHTRRAITLIDPPYELEKEYHLVVDTLKQGISRFNTGTYIVWYPLINRPGSEKEKAAEKMIHHIKTLFKQPQLHAEFCLDKSLKGMYGSGIAIINPPWGLEEQLREALTFLCKLNESRERQFAIQSLNAE